MAAALQWIASQGLAAWAGDADSAWAVCEEAAGCVRSGALRRGGVAGGGPGTADGLLSWVLEAGQDKAVPLARMAAFRLLGWRVGVLVGVALALTWHTPGSPPAALWFALLALTALAQVLPLEYQGRSSLRSVSSRRLLSQVPQLLWAS